MDNWPTFIRYITSGTADPTGRPFALLSFLIDAQNWPAEPFSFKRTNLLIHLTNAVLLYFLLSQLGKKNKKKQWQTRLAAVLGAGFWALHPLWVSTTLYVVQREAMLPTTFAALGILGYLRGREKIETGCRFGVTWVVGSITAFTLLAVLSKANGVLLPVLVLVVEFAFLRPVDHLRSAPQPLLYCLRATSYPLAALLIAYLVYVGISANVLGLSFRPWTEWQRLLQSPVSFLTIWASSCFHTHIREDFSMIVFWYRPAYSNHGPLCPPHWVSPCSPPSHGLYAVARRHWL